MPRLSPRRRPAAAVVTVALLAVLTACGGSDNTTPTAAPSPSTAAPTAAPTDPPTTTTAPTTTATPTTVPVVTDAPTTTLDPAAVEAQIRQDFEATYRTYLDCLSDPIGCVVGDVAVRGSEEAESLQDILDEFLQNNLRADLTSGPLTYTIQEIEVLSTGRATVRACVTDGAVLYDVVDPLDPNDDIVVSDALNSYDNTYELRLVGDEWRRLRSSRNAIYPGAGRCDA